MLDTAPEGLPFNEVVTPENPIINFMPYVKDAEDEDTQLKIKVKTLANDGVLKNASDNTDVVLNQVYNIDEIKYVPNDSRMRTSDNFDYVVVDTRGNESSISTVSLEICLAQGLSGYDPSTEKAVDKDASVGESGHTCTSPENLFDSDVDQVVPKNATICDATQTCLDNGLATYNPEIEQVAPKNASICTTQQGCLNDGLATYDPNVNDLIDKDLESFDPNKQKVVDKDAVCIDPDAATGSFIEIGGIPLIGMTIFGFLLLE